MGEDIPILSVGKKDEGKIEFLAGDLKEVTYRFTGSECFNFEFRDGRIYEILASDLGFDIREL